MFKKICLSMLLVTVAFFSTAALATTNDQALDRIAAVVNDDVITETQLDNQVRLAQAQLKRQNIQMPNTAELRKNILQHMIDLKLQLQLAKRSNIEISNTELNQAIRRLSAQNHLTQAQMYASVQQEGLSIQTFRDQLKKELTVQKLQGQMIASRIQITPQEVNDYLQANPAQTSPQYHLANILIALPDEPTPAQLKTVRDKAEAIVKKLRSGTDFKQLAATESRGSQALQGGDLGWRKAAELPEVFASHVKHMKQGEVAGPIQTPNGFHIIKLLGVKGATKSSASQELEIQTIFLKKTNRSNTQNKINTLTNLRKKSIGGTNFGVLAKKYSEGTNASHGGYMGWVKANQLQKDVANAAFKLRAGEISEPVVVPDGVYLVKVIAKRNVQQSSKARTQEIQELIFRRKLEENVQTFINGLRDQAYIKVM
ncbi:MAG: peptidylprolyl isomerase [Pseudomonadota bacterium]|nr:peptidylprolyl isomerase [Gammaproteobacteria bacterium]MBU1926920.1 peptidylprolyl isomerase [Gammaproteobacteria bacterium]MBU2546695.1 peptidylprolyl isomerase [Gammaproteobacteria bacterium]